MGTTDMRIDSFLDNFTSGSRSSTSRSDLLELPNIEESDEVLLKQSRENMSSQNCEPQPYIVTNKDENAVILQDTNGNNKTRNIARIKKFVDPETVDKREIDPQPPLTEQSVQPEQDHPDPSRSQPAADTPEASSSPLPVRARQAPTWM